MNNSTSASLDALTHVAGDFIEIGFHSLIFLIGVPLNIVSLRKQLGAYNTLNKAKQTGVKFQFLLQKLNLNVANLLTLLLVCPIQVGWFITYQWVAGDAMCKIVLFAWMFLINASSNIVAVIAIERLKNVLILERLWKRQKNRYNKQTIKALSKGNTTKCLLSTSWVIAALCSLPQLWFWFVLELRKGFYQCTTLWKRNPRPSNGFPTFYNAFHLCTTFWLPFIIIAICYVCIFVKLLKLSCQALGERQSSLQRKRKAESFHCENVSQNWQTQINQYENIQYPESTKHLQIQLIPCPSQKPLTRKARSADVSVTVTDYSTIIDETFSTVNCQPLPQLVGIPTWRLQMRSKIFQTTGLIVLAYAVFWLPYNILGVLVFTDEDLLKRLENHINWTKSAMLLTAVVNPILYGW